MKKGLIVLLVAVLASSFAFAGFSGSASVGFNYDIDSKDYGFSNGKGTGVSLTLANEKIEVKGESDIYAAIKASFDFKVAPTATANLGSNAPYSAGVIAKISEAKIYGDNWFVDITGSKGPYDYAKSPIDGGWVANKDMFNKEDAAHYGYSFSAKTYKAPFSKAAGVTVGYDGWTLSGGLLHNETDADYTKGTNVSATIETKSFKFAEDSITVQAAIGLGQTHVLKVAKAADRVSLALGASAKASYAKDAISASLAADFGVEKLREDTKEFRFDAVASFGYDFVSADAYISKTDVLYASAKVAADLNSFNIPVTVSFSAKDFTTDAIALSMNATYAGIENLALSASASYTIKTGKMKVAAEGTYSAEIFDVTLSTAVSKANVNADIALGLGVFASSSAIIDGATLTCGYAYDASAGETTNNLLGKKLGAIELGCEIAF